MTTLKKVSDFINHQLNILHFGIKSTALTQAGKHRYEGRIDALKEVWSLINGKRYDDNIIKIDNEEN